MEVTRHPLFISCLVNLCDAFIVLPSREHAISYTDADASSYSPRYLNLVTHLIEVSLYIRTSCSVTCGGATRLVFPTLTASEFYSQNCSNRSNSCCTLCISWVIIAILSSNGSMSRIVPEIRIPVCSWGFLSLWYVINSSSQSMNRLKFWGMLGTPILRLLGLEFRLRVGSFRPLQSVPPYTYSILQIGYFSGCPTFVAKRASVWCNQCGRRPSSGL